MKNEQTSDALSARELQIAKAYSAGDSYRKIAEHLFIAPTTVKTHLRAVYRKLGVSSKIALLLALNAFDDDQNISGDTSGRPDPDEVPGKTIGEWSGIRDRPTIAVLPFRTLSNDPDQEFFADGLAEDIISRIGYIRGAVVTSRTSSFVFKGHTEKLSSEISKILGARYLVEGSVRTQGNRMRITAKLIDGQSDTQIWSKRFDRETSGVFELQDEITHEIVESLQISLSDGKLALDSGGTRDFAAWELFQRGAQAHLRYTPEDVILARDLFARALVEDPGFSDAKAFYAWTFWQEARSGFADDPNAQFLKVRDLLDTLQAQNVPTPGIKHLEAATLMMERRFDQAIIAAHDAAELGPSRLFGYTPAAIVHLYCGHFQKARELLREGIRKIPYTPTDTIYNLSVVSGLLGDTADAVALAEEYMRRVPQDLYAHTALALAYKMHGSTGKADETMQHFRQLFPSYRLSEYVAHEPFKDENTLDYCIEQLRAAGLPE